MENQEIVEQRLKELFPKRKDRAEFLGVDANDSYSKIATFGNKIKWLETNLKPMGLILKIENDEESE